MIKKQNLILLQHFPMHSFLPNARLATMLYLMHIVDNIYTQLHFLQAQVEEQEHHLRIIINYVYHHFTEIQRAPLEQIILRIKILDIFKKDNVKV